MPRPDIEREQEELAAAQAAAIGGAAGSEEQGIDPAAEPLVQAGQGEAEGFEQAESGLIEHASHGDQHAARHAIRDAPLDPEDSRQAESGEPDHERSSERYDDE